MLYMVTRHKQVSAKNKKVNHAIIRVTSSVVHISDGIQPLNEMKPIICEYTNKLEVVGTIFHTH